MHNPSRVESKRAEPGWQMWWKVGIWHNTWSANKPETCSKLKRTLPTKKQTQLVLVQRQAGNRLLRFNLLRSKCWFGNVMAFRLGPSQRRFYSTWAAIRHRMSPDSEGSLAPFLFVSTSPLETKWMNELLFCPEENGNNPAVFATAMPTVIPPGNTLRGRLVFHLINRQTPRRPLVKIIHVSNRLVRLFLPKKRMASCFTETKSKEVKKEKGKIPWSWSATKSSQSLLLQEKKRTKEGENVRWRKERKAKGIKKQKVKVKTRWKEEKGVTEGDKRLEGWERRRRVPALYDSCSTEEEAARPRSQHDTH